MTDLIEGRDWLSGQSTYEGFPIYFRRPDIRVAEYSSLCADFPLRLTVTHFLAQVKDNGLPEADYNESLADFDHALIGLLRDSGAAIVTLVETFAGKRTYYLYLRQGVEPHAAGNFLIDTQDCYRIQRQPLGSIRTQASGPRELPHPVHQHSDPHRRDRADFRQAVRMVGD